MPKKAQHGGRRKNQTGRPPVPKALRRKALPTYLIPANAEWLRAESKRTGKSMSDIVNDLIAAAALAAARTGATEQKSEDRSQESE